MQDNTTPPNPPASETPAPQPPASSPEPPAPDPAPAPHHRRWIAPLIALVLLLLVGAVAQWLSSSGSHKAAVQNTTPTTTKQKSVSGSTSAATTGLTLDTSKDYGNKYSDGVLPVGDGKYVTSGPKQGYVYACSGYAQNLATDAGGAGRRGPWFSSDGTTYNINKKLHVNGSVMWQASFSNTISGGTRTITSNDLPTHPTGIFPIQASDPAYAYDRNPNAIGAQNFTYALAASPSYGSPSCIGGQVGVMLTGVALFSGFDAGGRDAGAWEVQDSCSGHPEKTGTYHYHTLSSCIKDTSVHTVIGFALDGFPITGPKVGTNNLLTTSDLDECHGITSLITLNGKQVTMYHYVMTQDFPYSVSCYRGTAIQPPGQAGPTTRQHP